MANKIMDVARPGATPADANSKPVIITHRPMVADPMVSTRPAPPAPAKPLTQAGKKLEPLSTGLKTETATPPVAVKTPSTPVAVKTPSTPVALLEAPDAAPAETPAVQVAPNATTPPVVAQPAESPAATEPQPVPAAELSVEQQSTESIPAETESKAKSEKQAIAAEQAKAARKAELRALVESKKYYLKIDDSATSSVRTFALTVLVILLIGAVGLVVAIDAGVLDLGINLPFNLIK